MCNNNYNLIFKAPECQKTSVAYVRSNYLQNYINLKCPSITIFRYRTQIAWQDDRLDAKHYRLPTWLAEVITTWHVQDVIWCTDKSDRTGQTNRPTDRDTGWRDRRIQCENKRQPVKGDRPAGHAIGWWIVAELSRPLPVRRMPDHRRTQLRNYFDAVSCPLLSPRQATRVALSALLSSRSARLNLLSNLEEFVAC